MKLFAGNGCPRLAANIATKLDEQLTPTILNRFSDGEIQFEILDHVRGEDVFIIQSTGTPSNDNLMELAIMTDALNRSASGRIIAIIPYYGYSRQDRRPGYHRTSITSRLVADLLITAGIQYVVTVDIHSEQQKGFYPSNVPFVNVSASIVFNNHMLDRHNRDDIVIVSPDAGGVRRATEVAEQIQSGPIAIVDKRRISPGKSEVHHIIGDVSGKVCIIIDDLLDTAGTIANASHALREEGASEIYAYATHPVLSGNAIYNIAESSLTNVYVTDTIPLTENAKAYAKETGHLVVLSVAEVLAETIRRIHNDESISAIYEENK